jgi:TP901 family phage tail tape measure protein
MSDVDIVLGIAVSGVEKVYNLSNAMQQLNRAVQGATNPMKNLDARSRALSAAIGSSDSSLKNHAKSVSELARNNAVLTNEMNRVRKEISGLGTSYKFATGASAEFRRAAVSDLKAYEASLKGIRVRALVEDLKSLSQEQKRLGKDAQFVGRSLIIGLTTPIMGFGRVGLQTLVAIDREFVRLNKVLESVAPNLDAAAKKMGVDLASATREQNVQLDKMVASYQALDKQLSTTSTKFGLAKSLTVGLAGDFAELGIQTTDNIALITELTAKTEKLGNMDIGAAKDLVQSLYFQAQRAIQEQEASKGPGQKRLSFSERETAAIKAATAQLNLFNSVENVTALTLKDLGDAFPEVAAAATSFGLSMTEAGALLAPMKAAGFEVGASANSIKVSLQRLTAPTKQNAELFKQLSKEYNTNFNLVKGTGLDAIQQLVDGFNEIKKSAAGQEGAMEFFSKVFGVRQGPRMEVAIAQLAAFDAILKDKTIPTTISAEKKLQDFANTAVTSANKAGKANLPLVNSFRDIGVIARIATATAGQQIEGLAEKVTAEQIKAAKEVRKELSKEILKAQREGGEDLIGQVGTEAGRAMFIELAGAANASQIAQRELEAALGSLDTQLSILKNNFKTFAADLLTNIKPTIEKLVEISTKLYNAWSNLDDQTKKLISTTALVVAGLTAAIGPLIFVFGQFRLAMGSVGKVLFGFIPGLKTMSVEALAGRDAMLRLTKPLQAVGDTVVNTNGKFATFIATLASGQGPVAKMAEKLGTMSGVLQKQTTAPIGLTREVMSQKVSRGLLPGVAGAEAIEYVGGPAATRRLRRTAGGIIDAEDPTLRVSRAARKAFAEEEFAMEQMGLRRGGASGTRYNIQQRAGILRRTMGYRSISGEDVGSAINLRQRAFEAAGIERTSTSSSLGGGILRRGGREISEERALGIARGGIRGRILGAIDTAGAKSDAAMGAIRALPSKAVTSYTGALSAAKAAQKALTIETLAFTGTGPSKFAQMRAGVMGFAKSFGLVNNAIKLTKITLIASGIGVIILSIGVAVMLVMKNMDKFKQAGASGFGTLKKIFGTLKQTIESLARPFIDLFSSFGNGAKDSEGAVQGLGNAFNGLTKVLEFVANMFKWLVENIIQPYLYGVVNLVKFVVNIFQGKWSDALKALAGAFANVFGGIAKLGIEVIAFLIKQIINILFELPSAFMKAWAWGIEKATDLFFGFVEWVLGQVKRIPVLGRFLGGVGDAALGGLKSARDTYLSTVRTVANAVNAGGDVIKRGIDSVADKAKGAVDKISKIGVKKSKGKLDLFGGKDENSVEVDTDDAQEAITSSVGSGFDEGAQEGAEKLVSRIKEIKKELQQEIADRIKDTMKNVVDILQETLKKQKEDALTVYDNQIKSIEAVGKAEQKLTREQEYQNKLREAELERSINRTNSRRSYAMAIYAGQIDEARNIADAAARQEVQDNENINQINQDRIREVAEENRNELIQSIKDAKDTSSKYFDSMITLFTDAAKKITEFPPTTAEEFNTMLNNLIEGGNGFIGAKAIANSMGQTFSDSFRGALSSLGVNATGPLTSSLAAISKTLADNNPFGPTGVWNKTIDESINALTRKYQGLTNTLTTIIDTKSAAFQKLYDIYNKYQNLVGTTGAGSNNTTPGTGGGSTTKPGYNNDGVKDGNKVSIATANADLGKIKQYSDKYLSDKYGGTAEGKKLVTSIKSIVSSIASSAVLLGGHDEGMKDFFPVVAANRYKDQITTNSELVYAYIVNNRRLFTKGAGAQARTDESGRSGFFKGGMPYAMGGPTKGPIQQGIPAILHGGEYVVRNSAVKKYGWGMMQQINQGTYKPKPYAIGGLVKGKASRNYVIPHNLDRSDPAYQEWKWQQDNGGLTKEYLTAIALAESSRGKTWGTLADWKGRVHTTHGWMGGGLRTNDDTWIDYGGKQFAETADQATKLQQMVVKNRIAVFGWIRKIAPGSDFPAGTIRYNKPLGTGSHGFDRKNLYDKNNKIIENYRSKTKEIPLPENFNPNISYEAQLGYNPFYNFGAIGGGFNTREAKKAYTKYFTKKSKDFDKITMPFSKPIWIKDGKPVKKYKDMSEFEDFQSLAIGGLVKGKKKLSSVADFRKFDQEGVYKYNYQAMMDQTSARIKAMKESGYNVANQRKVLNPFSDLAYKPENAKVSLWDKTLGKVATGVANTAKLGVSSFLAGVSFTPEFAVALGSTLLGKAGLGESQAKGSLFNQLIASPFMQTSLGQTLKAAKEMVTTGKDYRELMGLDRGPFGLAGFIPVSASERAMKEASQNRSILGKGTILSPGGLLAYYGLDKTGIAKEGSGAYMATNMGGDMLALLGLDPAVGISGIKSGLSKFKTGTQSGFKTTSQLFTKAGRETLADAYWAKKSNFFNKNPKLYKQYKELQDLKNVILMRKTRGMRPSSRGLLEDMSYPEYFYHQKEMAFQRAMRIQNEFITRGEPLPPWPDVYGGKKVRKFFGNAYESGLDFETRQKFSLPRSIYKTMLNPYYKLSNKINEKYPISVKIGNEITDIKKLIKNPKLAPKKFYTYADQGPFGTKYTSKTAEYFGERFGKPEILRDKSVLGDINNMFGGVFPALKDVYSELGISIREKTFDLASSLIPFKRNIRRSFGTGNRVANLTPENLAILNEVNEQQRIKYIRDSRIASIKDRIEKSKSGYYSGFKMSNLSSEYDNFPLNVRQQLMELLKQGNLEKLQKTFSENMAIGVDFTPYGLNPADGIGNYLITIMRRATKQSDAKYLGLPEMDFIPENALFPSASFNFSVSNAGTGGGRNLQIGGLYSLADFNQIDVSKLLAFVYMNIIKKHNVTTVTNGSYSKYSYALSDRLSAMMEFLDPSVQVITPPLSNWRPNNIEFPNMLTGGKIFQTELDREIFLNNFNRIKDILAKAKVKAGEKSLLQASKEAKKAGRVPKSADEWQKAYEDYSANARNMRDLQWMAGRAASSTGIDENAFRLLSWPFRRFLETPAGAIFMRTMRTVHNESLSPQSVLPPPPIPSRIIDRIPLDEVFNGGLIRGYETGGLVKGQKNTKTPSAADFRKFESKYSNWDLQSITYIAQQKIKDSKKNIFQKGLSSISGFFKKKGQEALYGSGNGFFAGLKSAQQLDSGQTEFSPRDPLSNPAYRTGFAYSKAASEMLLPYVGGAFAATKAMDKNRSTGDRSLNALFAGLGLIGPTTVFAPNSGYLTMPSKIKTLKNLDKLTDVATLRNVDQFFPGTRIPMPSGLIPTFSQEQGQILNQIGASASLGRTNYLEFGSWGTMDSFLPSSPDFYNERVSRLIRNRMEKGTSLEQFNLALDIVSRLNSNYRRVSNIGAPSIGYRDFQRLFKSFGLPDEVFQRKLMESGLVDFGFFDDIDNLPPRFFSHLDFDKMHQYLLTGLINGKVPKNKMRSTILENIQISQAIRKARLYNPKQGLSQSVIGKIMKDESKLFHRSPSYDSGRNTVEMWRKLGNSGSYGQTVEFMFSIDDLPRWLSQQGYGLKVDMLKKSDNIPGSVDLTNVMAYVYEKVLKPKGITNIFPGSTSPHSFILGHKLNEIFKVLDPNIKVHVPTLEEYLTGGSANVMDFSSVGYHGYLYEALEEDLASIPNFYDDVNLRFEIFKGREKITNALKEARKTMGSQLLDQEGVPIPKQSELRDLVLGLPDSYPIRPPRGNFNGGLIRGFANGGFVSAFASQGVPAMLHGGEYVINSSAVKNLGLSALEALNQMRFNAPKSPSYSGPVQPQSSSTSTVHIYVDNFIGEKAWFESMMKDYNINVAPQNQKAAGLNNTTISTYRGINRGL